MQLPLLASTFLTVFLAELGDKTQLAIVTISGTSNRSGAVFAGSASALVLASLLGAGRAGPSRPSSQRTPSNWPHRSASS